MQNKDPGIHFFPEIGAGGFSRIDSTIQFYERVNALAAPNFVILDFGPGRGAAHSDDPVRYRRELRDLRDKVDQVIGADIDPIVETNPMLHRSILVRPGAAIPLADESIHLIISDFVFEHLEDPAHTASELDRILIPGGWICARTPNRYGYVALVNQLAPKFLRMPILRLAQPKRSEHDVFRPYYRLNTLRAIRAHFNPTCYKHFSYYWDAEPAYHADSKAVYRFLLAIQRLTPPRLKTLILAFLRKNPK